jgi:hypothetical protein
MGHAVRTGGFRAFTGWIPLLEVPKINITGVEGHSQTGREKPAKPRTPPPTHVVGSVELTGRLPCRAFRRRTYSHDGGRRPLPWTPALIQLVRYLVPLD